MAFPYMLQRIKRQPAAAIVFFSLNFVAALLLCVLHNSSIRLNTQIEEVYKNAVITCEVSNLTGTQTEDLNLNEGIIRLFMGDSSVPNSQGVHYYPDGTRELFRSYLSSVSAKVSIRGEYLGDTVNLVGLTDMDAERALREEYGARITWEEPFDAAVFSQEEAYCLIPVSMLSTVPETRIIELTFYTEEQPVTKELRVVGTHNALEDRIYCPWSITTQINQEIDGWIHADSISAVIRDSKTIPEFWEKAASHYFAEPNAKGGPTPGEGSPVNKYFPYALLINDVVLKETVSGLQKNLFLFRLCTAAILALSLILGLVAGFLIVRQRVKALALQRILGQSNGTIFAQTWLELTAVTALGIIAGALASGMLRNLPWEALLASLVFYMLGITIAIFSILRTDLIRSIKEDA